jgi:hypothetical protein
MAEGGFGGGTGFLDLFGGFFDSLFGGSGSQQLTEEQQLAIIRQFAEANGIQLPENTNPTLDDLFGDNAGELGRTGEDIVDSVTDAISDSLEGLISSADSDFAGIAEHTISSIQGQSNNILGSLGNSSNTILSRIGDLGRGVLNTVANVFGGTSNAIEQLIRGNIDLVEALERVAIGAIRDTVEAQTTIIADAVKKVDEAAAGHIEEATRAAQETNTAIIDALKTQTEIAKDEADTIQSGLQQALDTLSGESSGALEQVATATQSQTMAIGELGDTISEGQLAAADRIVAGSFGESGPDVFSTIKDYLGVEQEGTFDIVIAVLRSFGVPEEMVQEIHGIIEKAGVDGVLSRWLFSAIFWAQASITLTSGVAQVALNPILQRLAKAVPSALPSIQELQQLLNRGLTDTPQALEFAARQGFDPNVANALFQLKRELPDIGIVQTWFLREFIDRGEAKRRLSALGFVDADADALIEMAFFIPPVADLITMAVREVFSPEVAQRFGQFEDFPEDFAKYAAQQGVSEQWARNYWAAHWALPSAQQGFEMFQRRFIGEEDLKTLLRALDVMPFWRDNLIKIAYRPLTRVDIRRMHDLGILNREDVKLRYQDIGYSPDDAEIMTKFTEAYNSDTQTADPAGLEHLSRSVITQLYTRGVLSKGAALDLLQSQGIGGIAAEIYLTNADMEQELKSRDEQTSLVLEQAKAGILTFDQAQDRLASLGLTGTELESALTSLYRQQAAATKLPSVTQLGSMFKARLITEDEYRQTLQAQGYSAFWAERFVQLETGSRA